MKSVSYTHLDVYKRQALSPECSRPCQRPSDRFGKLLQGEAGRFPTGTGQCQPGHQIAADEQLLADGQFQSGTVEKRTGELIAEVEEMRTATEDGIEQFVLEAVSYTHLDVYKRQSERREMRSFV